MLVSRYIIGRSLLLLMLTLVISSTGCQNIWTTLGFNIQDFRDSLFNLATAGAALMISIQGIKWIGATEPEERNECKKAVVYIILALILVASVDSIVDALYCSSCNCCTTTTTTT